MYSRRDITELGPRAKHAHFQSVVSARPTSSAAELLDDAGDRERRGVALAVSRSTITPMRRGGAAGPVAAVSCGRSRLARRKRNHACMLAIVARATRRSASAGRSACVFCARPRFVHD
jgi:hypothetical protein